MALYGRKAAERVALAIQKQKLERKRNREHRYGLAPRPEKEEGRAQEPSAEQQEPDGNVTNRHGPV